MTKRILVIGPAWIGDAVMTQVTLKILKNFQPGCLIDIAAPSWTLAVFQAMPEVNEVIALPFKHGEFALKKRWQIARELNKKKYDQAIIIPNSFKSALIPFFAGISKRSGFHREGRGILLNDARKLNKKTMPLMIDRLAELAVEKNQQRSFPLPWPELKINLPSQLNALKRLKLNTNKPILILCPGAEFGPSKRWLSEYFLITAKHFIASGWQVWLMGSQKDKAITQQIHADGIYDLAGETNLAEAIDLMACARAVLTNDTGLMHIAAALNKAIVAIYGSSSPAFTPPLAKQIKILDLNIECSPCFARDCPLKHHRCMVDLKPEMAIEAVEALCAS